MYDKREQKLNFANYEGPIALFILKKIIMLPLIVSVVLIFILEYGFEENPDIWHSRNLLYGITLFLLTVSSTAISSISITKDSLDNDKKTN